VGVGSNNTEVSSFARLLMHSLKDVGSSSRDSVPVLSGGRGAAIRCGVPLIVGPCLAHAILTMDSIPILPFFPLQFWYWAPIQPLLNPNLSSCEAQLILLRVPVRYTPSSPSLASLKRCRFF
jgi:hypothetical protein